MSSPSTEQPAANGSGNPHERTAGDVYQCLLTLQSSLDDKLGSLALSLNTLHSMIQSESIKRDSIQSRLNAQLLLQSESLIAMELKVLRLEAQLQHKKMARGSHAFGPVMEPSLTDPATGSNSAPAASVARRMPKVSAALPSFTTRGRSNSATGMKKKKRSIYTTTTSKPALIGARSSSTGSAVGPTDVVPEEQHRKPLVQPAETATLMPSTFLTSSGASLASGVTGTSEGEGFMEDEDDLESAESASISRLVEEVVEEEEVFDDEEEGMEESMINDSDSTPTSRHSRRSYPTLHTHVRIAPTLESMLQGDSANDSSDGNSTTEAVRNANDYDCSSSVATSVISARASSFYTPVRMTPTLEAVLSPENHPHHHHYPESVASVADGVVSTRAIRGPRETDGASSLATSVTSATLTTTVTATTRGSIARTLASRGDEGMEDGQDDPEEEHDDPIEEGNETIGTLETTVSVAAVVDANAAAENAVDTQHVEMVFDPTQEGGEVVGGDAPRSRSQSPLTVPESIAQESVGTNSMGVSFCSTMAVAPTRAFSSRRAAAAAAAVEPLHENRPLTNRVVSFVYPIENVIACSRSEAGDSVTMPDELDNLSDVVDLFATSARRWREDYESRLEAIQKQLSDE